MASTRSVDIHLEAGGETWRHVRVRALAGREAVSQLFSFDVDVVCAVEHDLPEGAAPGEEVTLVFEKDDVEVRRLHAVIASIRAQLGAAGEHAAYRLHLAPRAVRLSLVETQEIYLGKSIPEIVRTKLERHDFAALDFDLRLTGSYPARDFVVQYRESDLAFVSRLCEHAGISFYFEHEDGHDRMIFTDHAAGFRPIADAEEAPFAPRGERDTVFALDQVSGLAPTSYIVQDYNYRTPKVDLSAVHDLPSGNGGGVVEHGPHVKTPREAESIARIRAEERRGQQSFSEGKSGVMTISAGRPLRVLDVPKKDGPEALLIIEVNHEARFPVFDEGEPSSQHHYANAFRAVATDFAYRPPRTTPRPRIDGLVTGVIQPGPDGETGGIAQIDAEGRYTVQLHFDTAAPGAQRASHPIRMAQPFAGPSYGMHFPLRRGTEVAVAFVNGDPDRPIIVGALYNTASPSPVVASNATTHQIKSSSGVLFEFGSKS